jgi:hypothetical protein
MDEAVDQVMARSTTEEGATKSNAIRKAQARDRAALAKSIETNQKLISVLNDEAAPIRAEIRKVEAEVGPIKYIAAFIYDDNPDSNTLERAVRWVIILIVIVFDPLAIALVLAANASKEWDKEEPQYEMDDGPLTDEQVDQLKKSVEAFDKQEEVIEEPVPEKSVFEKYPYLAKPFAHFKNLKPMVGTIEEPIKEVEPVKEPTVDSTVSIAKVEPVEFITDVSKIDTEGVTILNHDHGDYIIHDGKLTHKDAVKQLNPNMFGLTVDNLKKSNTNFGTKFPEIADKGDMFVRVDILPNRVFKFDGKRWIEINKETTDTYLHDQEYIKHLVKMIDDGQYEIELLSENEQREIENYLRNQKS